MNISIKGVEIGKYIKTIIWLIVVLVSCLATYAGSSFITSKRFERSIAKLDIQHKSIEIANIKLRNNNKELSDTNNELRENQLRGEKIIAKTRDIITEFEHSTKESKDIIKRIEAGVSALDEIIKTISSNGYDFGNSDRSIDNNSSYIDSDNIRFSK